MPGWYSIDSLTLKNGQWWPFEGQKRWLDPVVDENTVADFEQSHHDTLILVSKERDESEATKSKLEDNKRKMVRYSHKLRKVAATGEEVAFNELCSEEKAFFDGTL